MQGRVIVDQQSQGSRCLTVPFVSVGRTIPSEHFKVAAKCVLYLEAETTEQVVMKSRFAMWEGKLTGWHNA
jgi:hypothetical protein